MITTRHNTLTACGFARLLARGICASYTPETKDAEIGRLVRLPARLGGLPIHLHRVARHRVGGTQAGGTRCPVAGRDRLPPRRNPNLGGHHHVRSFRIHHQRRTRARTWLASNALPSKRNNGATTRSDWRGLAATGAFIPTSAPAPLRPTWATWTNAAARWR